MNDAKYIGMDVYTATISAAVRDSSGSLVMGFKPPSPLYLLLSCCEHRNNIVRLLVSILVGPPSHSFVVKT
jgi:hypothetical protein